MTDTLPQSLSNMTLSSQKPKDSKSKAKKAKGKEAKPERCPTYIPGIARDGRESLYFGYNINTEWLMEFAAKRLKPRPGGYSELGLVCHAMQFLEHESGIYTLSLEEACEATDDKPPAELIHWEDEAIPIIAICPSTLEAFRGRPTLEQVNKLSELLGGVQVPRWWTEA
ncbi:hypothetical protein BOTBODRAFT_28791 [Botryobasidium botryosum FD-172 SS1]|uniref:Uncharacterized protein n=1 Tax=Botryobasidium botryosum (strain FD-172 SS1) TaxID=930990 RepID=A0A067N2N9_BOTB1|nr:hypothetical protein BOTBODRAFT_28791 [Botryobasidium botryosum FD-172 SS1]